MAHLPRPPRLNLFGPTRQRQPDLPRAPRDLKNRGICQGRAWGPLVARWLAWDAVEQLLAGFGNEGLGFDVPCELHHGPLRPPDTIAADRRLRGRMRAIRSQLGTGNPSKLVLCRQHVAVLGNLPGPRCYLQSVWGPSGASILRWGGSAELWRRRAAMATQATSVALAGLPVA